jgi:GNAT superfamily N-acetyltransferase
VTATPDDPAPTVTTGPVVRVAERRDVPAVARTVTVALADSRWTRWALPQDGRVQRLTRLAELVAGHRGVASGTTWVSDDVSAVAAWEAPPGAADTGPVPADVDAALGRELPRLYANAGAVADTDALVAAVRPSAPHWFLTGVVTRPSARRHGLAASVLAPVLWRCDGEGTVAATAVHTWAAVRWLRRLGFEVAENGRTADGALPLYVLLRSPRS